MASNPYVNKVEYAGETLIDLTEDSVTPDKLMRGETAHDATGATITGMMGGLEVSNTEPTNPSVDVWFQEQQGTPVEVYTVPEINDMIAPAETSPTQAAHHVGEYIICVINGQAKLYKVINEISPGETLTVGGNIEAAAVGSALTSAIDVRQIQFALPNSVTVTKGNTATLLSNFDIKTITNSDLDYPPQNKTLIGASPLWTNRFAAVGALMDCVVLNGLLSVSIGITNVNSATFSSIRLLTFWR